MGEIGDAMLRGVIDAFTTEAGPIEVATALGWFLEQPPAAPPRSPRRRTRSPSRSRVPPTIPRRQHSRPVTAGAAARHRAAALDPARSPRSSPSSRRRSLARRSHTRARLPVSPAPHRAARAARALDRALRLSCLRPPRAPGGTGAACYRTTSADCWTNRRPRIARRWLGHGRVRCARVARGDPGLLCSLHSPAAREAAGRACDRARRRESRRAEHRLHAAAVRPQRRDSGAALVAVPGTATALPGLAVLPFVSAGLGTAFHSMIVDVELGGTLDLQGGIGVGSWPAPFRSSCSRLADPRLRASAPGR